MKPIKLSIGTKDNGVSWFILDETDQKYFNWRYRTFEIAFTVSEHIRKLWNECPLDRVRDSRQYFSFILDRTKFTEISLTQINEQWVPGFSHDTLQRSGF